MALLSALESALEAPDHADIAELQTLHKKALDTLSTKIEPFFSSSKSQAIVTEQSITSIFIVYLLL